MGLINLILNSVIIYILISIFEVPAYEKIVKYMMKGNKVKGECFIAKSRQTAGERDLKKLDNNKK